jgi:hypothetical protein
MVLPLLRPSNPTPPKSGTLSQQTNATAQPFPDQKNDLFRLQSDLRYIWKSWVVTLSYRFEKWDQANFPTDGLVPFVGDVTSDLARQFPRGLHRPHSRLTVGYRFR